MNMMGCNSHDRVTLYGKGEGILQMQVWSPIGSLEVNQNKTIPGESNITSRLCQGLEVKVKRSERGEVASDVFH